MILAIGLAVATPLPVFGQQGAFDDAEKVCGLLSQYAKVVMKARQANLPMATVMGMVQTKDDSPKLAIYKRGLVVAAYDELRWPFEDSQLDAVQEFENSAYLQCIRRHVQ